MDYTCKTRSVQSLVKDMNKNTSPQRNGEITWIQKKNKKK